jgi:hypothetical protein
MTIVSQRLQLLFFDSRRGLGIFLLSTVFKPALRPTQSAIQWVEGALSSEVKRLQREAVHPPPSRAGVKNAWRYNFTPSLVRLHGVVLS